MKKSLIFILLLLFSLTVSAKEIITTQDNIIRFELESYSPSPVQPGDEFTVKIVINNIGSKAITNFWIQPAGGFPFTIQEPKIQTISRLEPQEKKEVFFKVATNPAAVSGQRQFSFSYFYDSLPSIFSNAFTINVETAGKTIDFDKIKTTPERIIPGQPATLSITLKNSAKAALNDIRMKINTSAPLSIIGSTNEKRITNLLPGQEKTITFEIITASDAASKAYQFPLEIEYFDDTGEKFTRSNIISIIVEAKTEYILSLESNTPLIYGSRQPITLSLSNVAPSNLRFLTLEVKDTEGIQVIANPSRYLGNLEPDDFETAEFEIFIPSCTFNCKEEIMLETLLTFKDDFNNEIKEIKQIPLKVYTKRQAQEVGLIDGGNILKYLIIVLLIFFVIQSIKFYRKEKNLGQSLKFAGISIIVGMFTLLGFFRWQNLRLLPRKVKLLWLKASHDKRLR